VLTADYGKRFGGRTPNPPRAYRRHRLEDDLLSSPGTKDLTVPADFDALIAAGEKAGLALERYETLSRFLLDGGIVACLEAASGDDAASFKERAQIKTLLHPEGMGEAFKVMVQRKQG
jgi:SAM-dependent MidA family methyltransferase